MNHFGLPAATIAKIHGVLARHEAVEKAVLYGSRAKGTYRNGSDIDLTLFGHGLTVALLLKIMTELDDLLLPWTIDLSLHDKIDHPGLREHIARVGKSFYEKGKAPVITDAAPSAAAKS